jgi:hypothetical protein
MMNIKNAVVLTRYVHEMESGKVKKSWKVLEKILG